MIVLTQRDREIIQAVTTLKALTSTQIERLFYSSQQAQSKRCKELVNHKNLKRFRINNWTPYIYYIGKKPAQIQSILAISEFYTLCIENNLNVTYVEREKRYEFDEGKFVIVPDALIVIECDGVEYEFFIEVDNTKELSTSKYYRAYMEYGFLPPPVISISDRKRRNVFDGLEIIKLKLNLSNFKEIFLSYF